jgi:hypothetical protein
LAERLKAGETALTLACDVANSCEDVCAIEQEFDAISGAWTDARLGEVWWVLVTVQCAGRTVVAVIDLIPAIAKERPLTGKR